MSLHKQKRDRLENVKVKVASGSKRWRLENVKGKSKVKVKVASGSKRDRLENDTLLLVLIRCSAFIV